MRALSKSPFERSSSSSESRRFGFDGRELGPRTRAFLHQALHALTAPRAVGGRTRGQHLEFVCAEPSQIRDAHVGDDLGLAQVLLDLTRLVFGATGRDRGTRTTEVVQVRAQGEHHGAAPLGDEGLVVAFCSALTPCTEKIFDFVFIFGDVFSTRMIPRPGAMLLSRFIPIRGLYALSASRTVAAAARSRAAPACTSECLSSARFSRSLSCTTSAEASARQSPGQDCCGDDACSLAHLCYSRRSASIGIEVGRALGRDVAEQRADDDAEQRRDDHDVGLVACGQSICLPTNSADADAEPTPAPTPSRASTSASARNWRMICSGEAPIAARMPISCVRSATDTSWMFMMPMPPTSSDTAAMPAEQAGQDAADLLRPPRSPRRGSARCEVVARALAARRARAAGCC